MVLNLKFKKGSCRLARKPPIWGFTQRAGTWVKCSDRAETSVTWSQQQCPRGCRHGLGPSPVCSSVRLGHNDYADSGARGRMPGITIMLDCAPEKNHPRGACPRKIFAAASPQAEKSPQLAQSVQRRRQNWKKARKMLRKFGPFLGWRRRNGAATARIGPQRLELSPWAYRIPDYARLCPGVQTP